MPRKPTKTCGRCKYLFTEYRGVGECFQIGKSTGMQAKACREFKEGLPLNPTFKGKKSREVKFDPTKPVSFVLRSSDTQILALMWDVDREGYGHWRIKQIGLSATEGPVTKEFSEGNDGIAFYGDITVVGARQNELWRADGFDDDDERDEEKNVVNKPTEVRIYPRRYED